MATPTPLTDFVRNLLRGRGPVRPTPPLVRSFPVPTLPARSLPQPMPIPGRPLVEYVVRSRPVPAPAANAYLRPASIVSGTLETFHHHDVEMNVPTTDPRRVMEMKPRKREADGFVGGT